MAGFVAIGNNQYIGTLKLITGASDLENGMFAAPVSWTNGTCSTPTANTVVPYFVVNEIDTVAGEITSDLTYKISAGDYVKMKKLLPGETFVTTKTAAAHSVGDTVDCGTTGVITASTGSPKQTYTVIEKPTLWGVTAYKCIVNN
jgi:hypothetical protein